MHERLFHEIFHARQRVYAVGAPTPLERIELPGVAAEAWVKREDLSPIRAYKWRGAYNRMALLTDRERARGVATASAGNHAQGVALAARHLGMDATIVMPVSTPRMKQVAVKRHGGSRVEIMLHGDNYNEAMEYAHLLARETGRTYIHAYDDWAVMGGQGTIADEVVMSGRGPFDVAFLQIGGGGMAGGVACWLRRYYPSIRIIGVEGTDQASMAASVKAGEPVTLDKVDVFCDGTAVKRPGDLTFGPCRDLIDEFVQVTNEEVCAAIQLFWESARAIPEPSGAMGLAGLMKRTDIAQSDARVLTILCGANMDFGRLAWIARHAGIGAARRRYYRCSIKETPGSLIDLLETALEGINIIEFQYGKIDAEKAWPVIGFEASAPELDLLDQRLRDAGIEHEDVTSKQDVEFRIIHYDPALFANPYFFRLDFPERPGALRDFLVRLRNQGSLCYFNYVFTGEEVGRALVGVEFQTAGEREMFLRAIGEVGREYNVRPVGDDVVSRIL